MEFVEALGPDGFHDLSACGVQFGLLAGTARDLTPLDSKSAVQPSCTAVPIVDEMGHVSEEALCRIEQVAGDLCYPSASGSIRIPAMYTARDFSSMTNKTMILTVPNTPRVSTAKKSQA